MIPPHPLKGVKNRFIMIKSKIATYETCYECYERIKSEKRSKLIMNS